MTDSNIEAELTAEQLAELTSARGKATASMVLGICGLAIFLVCSCVALPMGRRAQRILDNYPPHIAERYGATMAKAGVILGWVGVGVLIALGVILLALLAAAFALAG